MGNKVIDLMKDPIDSMTLKLVAEVTPYFYRLNFTPNMITTLGIISRMISIYLLFQGQKVYFLVGQVIGYFFDVMDGYYARRYQMTSKFGDLLDHLGDLVNYSGKVYYLVYASQILKSNYALFNLTVLALLSLSSITYLGCQEKNRSDDEFELVSLFKILCVQREWIWFLKWFGPGVLQVYLIALCLVY